MEIKITNYEDNPEAIEKIIEFFKGKGFETQVITEEIESMSGHIAKVKSIKVIEKEVITCY